MKVLFQHFSRSLMLLFLATCMGKIASAQIKISGKVLEKSTKAPMDGVAIRLKGSTTGTSTNSEGIYSITVPSSRSVLEFSFVGYAAQQVTVGSRTEINLELEEDIKGMDEVVIGYQTVQRRRTTAAVGSVKGKEFENTPYTSFDQMLQGRVAGLTVLSVSGEPGSNNIVNIRGTTSLQENGISQPLYVIDGIVFDVGDMPAAYGNSNPLTSINPNDIESVDILKDASASAIYGARAANGVILVKTKRPKSGKPEMRISAYTGVSDRPALKPVVAGAAERRMKMALLQAGGDYARIAAGNMNLFLTDSLNPAFNNNVDWQGMFLQKAHVSNIDASVAANEEKYAYRLAINRYTEEGVMKGYDFQRLAPRLFLQLRPAKNVQIINNLYMSFQKSKHGTGDGGRYPFYAWGFPSSFWALSEENIKAYTGRLDELMDDDRTSSINGNTKVEITLAKNLLLSSTLDYNFNNNRRDWYYDRAVNPAGVSTAINNEFLTRRYELTNMLTYYTTIKQDHNLSFIVGQGAEEQVVNNTYMSGTDITLSAIKTIQGVPAGPNLFGYTSTQERSRLSFFGRASYSFRNKYMLDLNYRRDASSRFGRDNRWGEFPAVSAGWVASDEAFFKPVEKVVSFLKFRASYGITGVDPGSYYAQYLQLTTNASYPGSSLGLVGNGNVSTYNGVTVAYPNYTQPAATKSISWERSPQYNVGVDMGLFNDRINITADWYVRDSKDKVFDVAVPVTTGYTLASDNYVSLRNTGLEFTINANMLPKASKLRWNLNFNVAYNDNYITKLPDGGRDFFYGPPWMRRSLSIGQPLFSFQVWQVDGVYASTSDVPVDPLTGDRMRWANSNGPLFSGGDPARRDMNGDYVINDLDRVTMGSPNPDIAGGISNTFSYKNFSLDILCSFISGRKLWNGYLSDRLQDAGTADPYWIWGGSAGPAMDFQGATFWTKEGDNATYPSLITNTVDKWHIAQSMFVEDASFFRMKRISLGYALPQTLVNKAKLKQVRVYGLLDNVFVLSRATVPDPEAVEPNGYSSGNDYPMPKKFTVGIDISF